MTGFVNGDFETGNKDGWSETGPTAYGGASAVAIVNQLAKHNGGYGMDVQFDCPTIMGGANYTFFQTITTDFITIAFSYKLDTVDMHHRNYVFCVSVTVTTYEDEVTIFQTSDNAGSWINLSFNKDEIDLQGQNWDETTTIKVRVYMSGLA